MLVTLQHYDNGATPNLL